MLTVNFHYLFKLHVGFKLFIVSRLRELLLPQFIFRCTKKQRELVFASRWVLRQGFRSAGIGVTIGAAASVAVARLMRTLICVVSAGDPLTFIGVTALLACVALMACYILARRAMRVDPLVALRYE